MAARPYGVASPRSSYVRPPIRTRHYRTPAACPFHLSDGWPPSRLAPERARGARAQAPRRGGSTGATRPLGCSRLGVSLRMSDVPGRLRSAMSISMGRRSLRSCNYGGSSGSSSRQLRSEGIPRISRAGMALPCNSGAFRGIPGPHGILGSRFSGAVAIRYDPESLSPSARMCGGLERISRPRVRTLIRSSSKTRRVPLPRECRSLSITSVSAVILSD